jgi:translation initiation factor IF-1
MFLMAHKQTIRINLLQEKKNMSKLEEKYKKKVKILKSLSIWLFLCQMW